MATNLALPRPARRPRLRLTWARLAPAVLPATILFTLAFEFALAERKYALFGGGFGQSQALDAPLEIAAFLVPLAAAHSLLFYLLYRLIRRLHGSKAATPLFPFNFACFAGLGWAGAITAKYEALSYFSDAMSFEIVRNLGGGSLAWALLYTLSEAVLPLVLLGGALLVYLAALLFLRRRWREVPPLANRYRLGARQTLGAAAAVALLLYGANRVDDARPALGRFTSVDLIETALDEATDFDRDGWSLFSWPVDRHPFNAALHPYALDVPNNGIDEDGHGGDLAFSGSAAPEPAPVIAGRKRHVILIVLESTRADSIGRRIAGRAVAPTMEALAAHGSAAREAYSHVGFTSFSLKSLFTGRLAPEDDRQSLVRDFLANGYRVGVFSSQAEDFGGIAATTGMRRGTIYVDASTQRNERSFSFAAEDSLSLDGRVVLRQFDRRLGRRDAWAQPNFLYFNFQSAHFPYSFDGMPQLLPGTAVPRSEITAANRDWVARTYWNAVAYNDRLIAALIARLDRLGVLQDSLVVVTADHGESLFDDGFLGHGHALNSQQTRIPFILSDPNVAMPPVIGLADMRRIILRAAGAPIPSPGPRRVFQYLGDFDRPAMIGTVGPGGDWIRFDPYREAVWTSRSGRWTPYSRLSGAGKAAADALIDEWARQRWIRHEEIRG